MPKSPPVTSDPVLDRVLALVAPLCVAHGVDLVSLIWAPARTLRLTIERRSEGPEDPNAQTGWGVSLDDCAELSRDVSRALDAEDFIPGHYSLEVSSPGLERDLDGEADFRRFVGFLAKVKLSRPAPDGQRLLRGTILSLTGPEGSAALSMRVDNKDITVPFDSVTSANLVYELPSNSPKAPRKAGGSDRRGSGGGPSRREPARRSNSVKGA
ncbi:MAG: ribosome maturation factor RimP [Myxococcales bacterium]|nr:ribosome maturation factor RimP [Myxococcales bacterium]